MQHSIPDSSSPSEQTLCVCPVQPTQTLRLPSRTRLSQINKYARWIIVGILLVWCAMGWSSAQAQDSDFFKLTLTNKTDPTDVTTTTTTSNTISEVDETPGGKNLKLDSITVPINDFFGEPGTGPSAHSDDLVISTINGIMSSDTGPEPGFDTPETVRLWSLDITFTSGASDSLKVIDNNSGMPPGKVVIAPDGESGSLMVPALKDQGKFGDKGDKVDLNSFTISFTSDTKPSEEPPAGTGDPVVDGRTYALKVEAVSDGASVPESSTWAMMLLGFAGLGFLGYRRARAGRTTLAA
jgi:hypothetical protein